MSAWLEVRQHPLRLLGAVAAGGIVAVSLVRTVTPLEYSLLFTYALRGRQVRLEEMPLLVFAMEAPVHVLSAWVAARCARRCRVPAVVLLAGLSLSSGVFALWMNAQSWPAWAHFSVWPWLWLFPADVVLILFGGGLLTGAPQRARRA
jgi:hypothetical protein